MDSVIEDVRLRKIIDSRGNPTVEVDVILENGVIGRAAVPSGASTGEREALEMRDGGNRYMGKGVLNAVNHVNNELRDLVIGMDAENQKELSKVFLYVGIVLAVFAEFGVELPHYSVSQSQKGTANDVSEALPGDLIFYSNGKQINHVAIYIGNGQVVHASSPKTGIKISKYNYRTPVKARRILVD